MPDPQQNDQPEPQSQDGGNGEPQGNEPSAEDKFWSRIDERLDAAIERGVKKHISRARSGPNTARTGRTTLPGILAELMGGPFTPESKRNQP